MQIFLISLAGCSALILLLREVAHGCGVVDHPCGRKQHAEPTPLVGGVAMYLAALLVMLWKGGLAGNVAVLMGCAAVLMMLGMLDDKHGLSVHLRMLVQVFLASIVIVGAEGAITHLGALFGSDIQLGMFAVPFSVIAFVGGINAINMIDGADGMAGKMVLVTMLGVASICCLSKAFELISLAMAIIGALAGFLLFNTRIFIRRAWVFMGDAGSMWLGFALCWFLAQLTKGVTSAEPALALWLFGIPLVDTLVVMMRRMKRKQSPFAADRTHIHHVLEHAGLSVRRTVLVLGGVQVIMVGTGVIFYMAHAPAALVFWSFAVLFAAYYYRLRNC